MDMYVYDFDAQFEKYLNKWVRDNSDLYKTMEELEGAVEEIYLMWLDLPAKWLDGETPKRFFAKYEDAELLVKWMEKYINGGVPVPDVLLDAITALGIKAEAPLLRLKSGQSDIIATPQKMQEAAGICVKLLNEIGSKEPMVDYIKAIIADPKGEQCESMVESLSNMGADVVDPILERIDTNMEELTLTWLLSVLVEFPGDARITAALKNAFCQAEEDRALFAAFMGKYGDTTVIPVLQEALSDWGLNYLEWIETRNAIEELGGSVTISEPDFSDDPFYESMKQM